MKKTIFLMLLICFPAVDALVFNQVLYDPLKTESGGEAIELLNNEDSSIDISDYFITTERSEKDIILPKNTVLRAGAKFLIADEGWNLSKDNSLWRNPDFESTMTLNNHDSGIILKDKNNKTIDFLSWGSKEEIPSKFLLSEQAKEVKEGNAFSRISFTGDNSRDFKESAPLFFSENTVFIELNITNSLAGFIVDDDSPAEGIQIKPFAGQEREITVNLDSSENIVFLNQTVHPTKINNSFEAKIKIPYFLQQGNYTIKGPDLMFEILELKSFEVKTKIINTALSPGKNSFVQLLLANNGNVPLDISIDGSELTYENRTLSKNIWSKAKTFVDVKEEKNVQVYLNTPKDTPPGIYRGVLKIFSE